MTENLWQLDAGEVAAGVRAREFSCVEVCRSVSDRIRALNPDLNAIIDDRTDEALAAAESADAALAAGAEPGPLCGVAVTVKSNIDVAGQPTPNGLPALAGLVAPDDSPVVRNLKAAGAIIVGRTNVPELSMRATTSNPLHGRTRNPWHPDASPGGSSGGAGAAAAAGFGPLHHGNDIGGSLRFPAFTCGVVTIKPTQGRIPAFNPSAPAERGLLASLMSTQGVIARSVADVALGTRILSAGDPRDPFWVPAPWTGPALRAPVRVAVTRNPHGYPAHAGVLGLLDRAAGALADAGYDVVEVEPPPITDAARAWFGAGVTELRVLLDPVVRTSGSEELQSVFDAYYAMADLLDGEGYVRALADRTRILRAWNLFLEENPLVLCPFLLRPTYPWDYDARGADATRDLFEAAIYSYGVNLLGLPAGVVPVDLVDDLPAGVQLVGRRYREDVVLQAMTAVEAQAGRLVERLWARHPVPG